MHMLNEMKLNTYHKFHNNYDVICEITYQVKTKEIMKREIIELETTPNYNRIVFTVKKNTRNDIL